MISNFFSQSKPINFVVVSFLLLTVFVLTKHVNLETNLSLLFLSKQLALFGVCLFSVFVLDFLVNKNNLTKKNSYRILLFVLFFAILPETILNSKTLLANLFILFAIRRIISVRTKKDVKKKLFDASFWVTVAAFFHFWSLLFFVLIIAALIVYVVVDIKNWLIPITGFATVMIIVLSYLILTQQDFTEVFNMELIQVSFDFSPLNSKRIIIGSTLIFSFGLWSMFYYLKNLKSKTKSLRPSYTLIIVAVIISLLIIVLSPVKNGGEFIFMFAPLAIIITNYFEVITEKWFKETLLWVLLLTPMVILLL